MSAERNRRGEPVVVVYNTNTRVKKLVADWFKAEGVELVWVDDPADFPRPIKAEFVLSTKNANGADERFAARCGGLVAIIPEALQYVLEKCQSGIVTAMVAYDVPAPNKI